MRSRLRKFGSNPGAQLSSAGCVPMQKFGVQVSVFLLGGAQHLPGDYCVSTFASRGDPTSIFWRGHDLASLSKLGLQIEVTLLEVHRLPIGTARQ